MLRVAHVAALAAGFHVGGESHGVFENPEAFDAAVVGAAVVAGYEMGFKGVFVRVFVSVRRKWSISWLWGNSSFGINWRFLPASFERTDVLAVNFRLKWEAVPIGTSCID